MTPETYQRLSLRTVPEPLQFWNHASDDARIDLFCNCALGLAGEAAEIDESPVSDEIGDGYWYAYVLFRVLDAPPQLPQASSKQDSQRTLYRASGRLCELAKKVRFHGRPLANIRDEALVMLGRYIDALAGRDDQSAAQTMRQNVDKLKARYPEGFFERG